MSFYFHRQDQSHRFGASARPTHRQRLDNFTTPNFAQPITGPHHNMASRNGNSSFRSRDGTKWTFLYEEILNLEEIYRVPSLAERFAERPTEGICGEFYVKEETCFEEAEPMFVEDIVNEIVLVNGIYHWYRTLSRSSYTRRIFKKYRRRTVFGRVDSSLPVASRLEPRQTVNSNEKEQNGVSVEKKRFSSSPPLSEGTIPTREPGPRTRNVNETAIDSHHLSDSVTKRYITEIRLPSKHEKLENQQFPNNVDNQENSAFDANYKPVMRSAAKLPNFINKHQINDQRTGLPGEQSSGVDESSHNRLPYDINLKRGYTSPDRHEDKSAVIQSRNGVAELKTAFISTTQPAGDLLKERASAEEPRQRSVIDTSSRPLSVSSSKPYEDRIQRDLSSNKLFPHLVKMFGADHNGEASTTASEQFTKKFSEDLSLQSDKSVSIDKSINAANNDASLKDSTTEDIYDEPQILPNFRYSLPCEHSNLHLEANETSEQQKPLDNVRKDMKKRDETRKPLENVIDWHLQMPQHLDQSIHEQISEVKSIPLLDRKLTQIIDWHISDQPSETGEPDLTAVTPEDAKGSTALSCAQKIPEMAIKTTGRVDAAEDDAGEKERAEGHATETFHVPSAAILIEDLHWQDKSDRPSDSSNDAKLATEGEFCDDTVVHTYGDEVSVDVVVVQKGLQEIVDWHFDKRIHSIPARISDDLTNGAVDVGKNINAEVDTVQDSIAESCHVEPILVGSKHLELDHEQDEHRYGKLVEAMTDFESPSDTGTQDIDVSQYNDEMDIEAVPKQKQLQDIIQWHFRKQTDLKPAERSDDDGTNEVTNGVEDIATVTEHHKDLHSQNVDAYSRLLELLEELENKGIADATTWHVASPDIVRATPIESVTHDLNNHSTVEDVLTEDPIHIEDRVPEFSNDQLENISCSRIDVSSSVESVDLADKADEHSTSLANKIKPNDQTETVFNNVHAVERLLPCGQSSQSTPVNSIYLVSDALLPWTKSVVVEPIKTEETCQPIYETTDGVETVEYEPDTEVVEPLFRALHYYALLRPRIHQKCVNFLILLNKNLAIERSESDEELHTPVIEADIPLCSHDKIQDQCQREEIIIESQQYMPAIIDNQPSDTTELSSEDTANLSDEMSTKFETSISNVVSVPITARHYHRIQRNLIVGIPSSPSQSIREDDVKVTESADTGERETLEHSVSTDKEDTSGICKIIQELAKRFCSDLKCEHSTGRQGDVETHASDDSCAPERISKQNGLYQMVESTTATPQLSYKGITPVLLEFNSKVDTDVPELPIAYVPADVGECTMPAQNLPVDTKVDIEIEKIVKCDSLGKPLSSSEAIDDKTLEPDGVSISLEQNKVVGSPTNDMEIESMANVPYPGISSILRTFRDLLRKRVRTTLKDQEREDLTVNEGKMATPPFITSAIPYDSDSTVSTDTVEDIDTPVDAEYLSAHGRSPEIDENRECEVIPSDRHRNSVAVSRTNVTVGGEILEHEQVRQDSEGAHARSETIDSFNSFSDRSTGSWTYDDPGYDKYRNHNIRMIMSDHLGLLRKATVVNLSALQPRQKTRCSGIISILGDLKQKFTSKRLQECHDDKPKETAQTIVVSPIIVSEDKGQDNREAVSGIHAYFDIQARQTDFLDMMMFTDYPAALRDLKSDEHREHSRSSMSDHFKDAREMDNCKDDQGGDELITDFLTSNIIKQMDTLGIYEEPKSKASSDLEVDTPPLYDHFLLTNPVKEWPMSSPQIPSAIHTIDVSDEQTLLNASIAYDDLIKNTSLLTEEVASGTSASQRISARSCPPKSPSPTMITNVMSSSLSNLKHIENQARLSEANARLLQESCADEIALSAHLEPSTIATKSFKSRLPVPTEQSPDKRDKLARQRLITENKRVNESPKLKANSIETLKSRRDNLTKKLDRDGQQLRKIKDDLTQHFISALDAGYEPRLAMCAQQEVSESHMTVSDRPDQTTDKTKKQPRAFYQPSDYEQRLKESLKRLRLAQPEFVRKRNNWTDREDEEMEGRSDANVIRPDDRTYSDASNAMAGDTVFDTLVCRLQKEEPTFAPSSNSPETSSSNESLTCTRKRR